MIVFETSSDHDGTCLTVEKSDGFVALRRSHIECQLFGTNFVGDFGDSECHPGTSFGESLWIPVAQ